MCADCSTFLCIFSQFLALFCTFFTFRVFFASGANGEVVCHSHEHLKLCGVMSQFKLSSLVTLNYLLFWTGFCHLFSVFSSLFKFYDNFYFWDLSYYDFWVWSWVNLASVVVFEILDCHNLSCWVLSQFTSVCVQKNVWWKRRKKT